ncbi:MAG: acyltransferase family protein [Steroidobacteraceae bacterium]
MDSAARHHHPGLDGLRGIAALAVLAHHVGVLRDWAGPFDHAYLAVDFFFLLSGYVIALAYEQRLREGLGLGAYLRIRLARLLPMVVLGAGLGAALLLMQGESWSSIGLGLVCALAFLPMLAHPGSLYPLNDVQWSLFFELLVNILHAKVADVSNRTLALTVAISALALIWANLHWGTLDVGWKRDNFIGGLPRAIFSFGLGLLMHRWQTGSRLPRWILPYPLVACLLTVLVAWPTVDTRLDWLWVLVFFPLLMVTAIHARPDHWLCRPALLAGVLSYPLYALHDPILDWAIGFRPQGAGSAMRAGFWLVVILTCIGATVLAERYWDRPLRRLLKPTGT